MGKRQRVGLDSTGQRVDPGDRERVDRLPGRRHRHTTPGDHRVEERLQVGVEQVGAAVEQLGQPRVCGIDPGQGASGGGDHRRQRKFSSCQGGAHERAVHITLGPMRLRTFSVIAVWAALCAPAGAQTFTGWDGTNPFNCELQQAGFEATGPDPVGRPVLRAVRQDPPERHRSRRRRLPRQGAGPAHRRPATSASTSSPITGAARSSRTTAPPRPTSGSATT